MPFMEAARKEKGFTQQQLAEMVGITQSALSRYEKGIRTPSVPTAQRIAAALGVEWTKFFEEQGNELRA